MMRFLFVYQDVASQARELLSELTVKDVHVVVTRKGETGPNPVDALLEQHRGSEAAACQLDRKYRKNVSDLVTFSAEPKKFRVTDQVLREWLVPTASSSKTLPSAPRCV